MSVEDRDDQAGANDVQRLKIFISYSRKDLAFADELVAGLEYDGGFEVLIDRDAIQEGEDWRARLGVLIASADTIVFVLSPSSMSSPICMWELEESERSSKRILPVQALPLDGVAAPQQLAALNYVRFDPLDDGRPRSFMEGMARLRDALKTDLGWLREHTRLLTRAQEWERSQRVENRMLVGSDIEAAKAWMSRRPKDAPKITELHHDYIAASEQAEVQRLSVERERVNQLEAALTEAEAARREEIIASKRAWRRTVIGITASIVLGIGGLTGGWAYKLWQENQAFAQRANRTDIRGQVVAYATSPGEVAMDGDGENSPYTTAVLKAFSKDRMTLFEAFSSARTSVLKASDGVQRPFLSSSLNADIYMKHQPPTRRRKALVVGANAYDHAPHLANANNDAKVWARFLEGVGFDVVLVLDPTKAAFEAALDKLAPRPDDQPDAAAGDAKRSPTAAAKINENTFITFFYAGHAMHRAGTTYLIPTEFDPSENVESFANMAERGFVNVELMKERLRLQYAASLIILDTVLDDPFQHIK